MTAAPLDIVYTWIDDSSPGFEEERRRYAKSPHDLNRQRTRDNLDLLKYSLRSVERFAPWRGVIHIVTQRPQAPGWLKVSHPGIRLVYLEEFMPAELIPCFNAFAIESYVHTIPSLSRRFVHFNDDMLLMAPAKRDDLEDADGKLHYYFTRWLLPSEEKIAERKPPFEAGRINTARALDKEFGKRRHPHQAHHPRIVDREDMERLIARFPSEFALTRAGRFRRHDTILPHIFLAAYLTESGQAHFHGARETNRLMWYVGLEDYAIWNRAILWWAMRHRPTYLALNDNFGNPPSKAAENVARRFLERRFPEPSAFER